MRPVLLTLSLLLSGCMTTEVTSTTPIESRPRERSDARVELGIGYLKQGNMIKARENFEIALLHDPNYSRAQLSLAHYFEQVGETQSAQSLYSTALKQHPYNGDVLNNYGTFLCKQKHYDQADDLFNQAIKQPSYYLISVSFENAALCSLKSGNKQRAREYFQRALAHQPDRPISLLNLAKLEIENEEYTDARLRLLRFHQRYGVKKSSLNLLIELEQKAGNKALEDGYRRQLEWLD
ncbi:type IV pilus biogenesis/stability protein PilW [Vibrio hepatarius]|uniref:type IV pilus biogenesis/stability protein PilW n=1 Tax=Vibrio hepatarius TaxID=171383 RepID=UPI003736F20D